MEFQTKLERLCTDGELYSARFVRKFGEESCHWERSNWFQREASLRHDMVCLLLCNTEPHQMDDDIQVAEDLEPPGKKRKVEEIQKAYSEKASTSGSSNTMSSDVTDEDFQDMGEDNRYRYILLEGRSNVIVVQNKLCQNFGIPPLSRQYDIFDRVEGKFVEVKVTKNLMESLEEFEAYSDSNIAFFHIHPESLVPTMRGKRDPLPGVGKVISFLVKRLSLLRITLGVQDTDLEYGQDMISEVFKCERFNNLMEQWVDTFWKLRNLPLLDKDRNPDIKDPICTMKENELKKFIEDTTLRETEPMKFKAKLMPGMMTNYIITTSHEDKEILNDLLGNLRFNIDDMQWILDQWNKKQDNFDFITKEELRHTPESLKKNLGIGQKGTIRYDHHPELVQKEFRGEPRLRYANWMSNLLRDITELDSEGLTYFNDFRKSENVSDHPIARISQEVVDKIFTTFGETELAAYCSKIKNFYSRLGGAYLKRNIERNRRPSVVIFPLYSSGESDGVKKRKVTGFVLRGPQHAKKPTDKIPVITFEITGNTNRSSKYLMYTTPGTTFCDNRGRKWRMKVNSISKQDSVYLTFVIDAIYLTANMVGEMTIANPFMLGGVDFRSQVSNFIDKNRKWFLERMAESVFMAVMGGSQEEGTLAAVRKIFMLKLNWSRGERAYGSDLKGFADSLNECLGDQPLALYFAKQFRDILGS